MEGLMKNTRTTPDAQTQQREFSFRAIFFGVTVGLMLMALMMYMDAVLGLDTDVAPIASMIAVLLIPLFGGPTNRREVNIMQTCATATTFAAYSLTSNMVPMLMMGHKLEIFPVIVLLLLSDAIGITFVSILRDQFVYDKSLPFPGAVMCTTALEQIDTDDRSSAKLLIGAVAFSLIVSFLQNFGTIPWMFDFTSALPADGMTLGIIIMPMIIGVGYVLGSRNALCMLAASLIVSLIEGPVGTNLRWFTNPAENYDGIQQFNLPVVIGMALFATLIPICKKWRTIGRAFQVTKSTEENSDRDYSMKPLWILLLVLSVGMITFCHIYYGISIITLIICSVLSLLFAVIAIRVFAESGLSGGVALDIFMMVIAYALTGSALYAMFIAFMTFNTFMLAQDTIVDLKIGHTVGGSPLSQIKTQFIGVIFGCVAGTLLFSGIISVFGLNDELFTYPFANMYYSFITGVSEGGVSGIFNIGRFALGGVLGSIFAFIGLPAGGIALALYLAPRTIMGIALGGVIRFIVEKMKGAATGEKLCNVATGLVIGDAMVCIIMVILSMTGVM